MKIPLHLVEPKGSRSGDKPPARGVLQEIADGEDVVEVTELWLGHAEEDYAADGGGPRDRSTQKRLYRQAICEAGLRRIVELCTFNAQNQMRWMGERNEDLNFDHDRMRRVLRALDFHATCTDPRGSIGASSHNRGVEVACSGMQFLETMLKPVGAVGGDARRIAYRDAWVHAHALEVVISVLQKQGRADYPNIQKQFISGKVALLGTACMYFMVYGSDGNTAYCVQNGGIEVVEACQRVHAPKPPRLRRMTDRCLEVLRTLKEDVAFELESEAQELAIIASQPGATTAQRVAAAKAAARVQVVRMDREK